MNINELDTLLSTRLLIKCACGQRNEYDYYENEPVRVVSKCRCGLTRLYYPLDKDEDVAELKAAL